MTTTDEIIENLKNELTRIGSVSQRDYDLLKRRGHVYSTTICRRLKLSWPEVIKLTKIQETGCEVSNEEGSI